MKPMRIGRILNLIRHAQGMTLKEMVKELERHCFSISPQALYYYETGQRYPSLENNSELVNVTNRLLRETLIDQGVFDNDRNFDMTDYIKDMLGKEALVRSFANCFYIEEIASDLICVYSAELLFKEEGLYAKSLPKKILYNWYNGFDVAYENTMIRWLLEERKEKHLGVFFDIMFTLSNEIIISPFTESDLEIELVTARGKRQRLSYKVKD